MSRFRAGPDVRGDPEAGRLVISGTGRAGTTFLVRLLTHVGFDTGFADASDGYDPAIRAGMEIHPRPGDPPERIALLPYVVKDPQLCLYLAGVLDTTPLRIRRLIVPVRPLDEAAASRVHRGRLGHPRDLLWLAESTRPDVLRPPGALPRGDALVALQRAKLAEYLGELVALAVTRRIPHLLLDSKILFENPTRLYIMLEEDIPGVAIGEFLVAHRDVTAMYTEGR
jgi:hypothetical protein